MENFSPSVFNLFKPAGKTSYDCIRNLKRTLPKEMTKRMGHFGTLDPFASGVLLVGVCGGTKINDYIHSRYSKTYLAVGKLGIKTDTGDITGQIVNTDSSEYLQNTIASFSKTFIEEQLKAKFLGEYMQAPPAFSAAKYQGKALHKWAREGVIIQKEAVKREIISLEVVKYSFPFLSIRFEVGSGTYIRTLFEECCQWLGSVGTLIALVRTNIGPHSLSQSQIIKQQDVWTIEETLTRSVSIDKALELPSINLEDDNARQYRNGMPRIISEKSSDGPYWVYHKSQLLGLGQLHDQLLSVLFNLS